MLRTLQGQCQCGSVQYKVTDTVATLFACHCIECQHKSGSAFGMAMGVHDPQVETHGVLAEWIRTTPPGKQMACRFCPVCGTRIFHQMLGQSTYISIKPGTLDDIGSSRPAGHIWTRSKQAWVVLETDAAQYPENPPGFDALFAAWAEIHGANNHDTGHVAATSAWN
ncbi:MAG: GFA family protein [Burkholderiales bacterium]|nr:GFA family protein [Burkholderiales bacterium]